MNLNDMNVTQLRDMAADLAIVGRSKMRKAELIEAITVHREAEEGVSQDADLEYHEDEDGFAYYLPKSETFASLPLDAVAEPQASDQVPVTGNAVITRDVPGAAFFNISDGPSGIIVRYGNVFELVTGSGETITLRARTMVKAVKRLAVKLGIHLDAIDTVKVF